MPRSLRAISAALIGIITSHAFALQVTAPSSVAEYVPFSVVLEASNAPLCDGPAVNVVGNVRLRGDVAEITVPPFGARCMSRLLTIPGLPRSVRSLQVSLTALANNSGGGTRAMPIDTVAKDIEVSPLLGESGFARFWTAEFRPALTPGPVRLLLTPSRVEMFTGQWLWLESGDPQTEAYTFKALSAPLTAGALPASLSRLYRVEYPAPFVGAYFTIDGDAARRLAREWSRNAEELPYALGRLDAGTCPMGMSPVYQVFNPSAVFHRWTQSQDTYRVLVAGGLVGEGAAWCAPNHD